MTKKGLHELSSSAAKKHLADQMCHNSALADDEEGDGEHQHGRHQLLSDGFQTDPRYFGDFIVSFHFFLGGGVECELALVLSFLMRIFTSDLFSGKMEPGCERGGTT